MHATLSHPRPVPAPETAPAFQRAVGAAALTAKRRPDGVTALDRLGQQGSLKVVLPRNVRGGLEAVLVNTAGGVTGGDRFDVTVHARAGTRVAVTTQAAERIYRAVGQSPGRVRSSLRVDAGARLWWLPQETILFDGCHLQRDLSVDVADGAAFLMCEALVFGRAASGERLVSGQIADAVSVRQGGEPLYLDRTRLSGDIAAQLDRPAVAAGAQAMASLVLVADQAEALLPQVRALLPATGGASLLSARTLVVRLLTPDSFALRQTLLPILTLLTGDALPKNWRL